MNIAKYQAFLCAAELGSFTKAAEKLGYTQSGLTHMMNSLEEEIGFPLLRRGYFGVRLTPNGTQLLSKIQELVKINDELESMIDDLRQNGCEVLRIGSFSSMTLHWLPSIVQQYNRDFPNVRVELTSGSGMSCMTGSAAINLTWFLSARMRKCLRTGSPCGRISCWPSSPKPFR